MYKKVCFGSLATVAAVCLVLVSYLAVSDSAPAVDNAPVVCDGVDSQSLMAQVADALTGFEPAGIFFNRGQSGRGQSGGCPNGQCSRQRSTTVNVLPPSISRNVEFQRNGRELQALDIPTPGKVAVHVARGVGEIVRWILSTLFVVILWVAAIYAVYWIVSNRHGREASLTDFIARVRAKRDRAIAAAVKKRAALKADFQERLAAIDAAEKAEAKSPDA